MVYFGDLEELVGKNIVITTENSNEYCGEVLDIVDTTGEKFIELSIQGVKGYLYFDGQYIGRYEEMCSYDEDIELVDSLSLEDPYEAYVESLIDQRRDAGLF